MWSLARRPRWIALLVLALALAAGFAALGQWQLARSIASGTVIERDTETVRQLDELTEPQASTTEAQVGQLVRVDGEFAADDYSVISERLNHGEEGYWIVGHLQTDAAALAVAVGWTASEAQAASVLEEIDLGAVTVTGRYVPPESPQLGDFENGERTEMSPAALVNEWAGFTGPVYSGYLVSSADVTGLERIDAPIPVDEVAVNWLNIFYAAEWAVFAVFAVFLWYRLVKDAWEREEEERAEEEERLRDERLPDERLQQEQGAVSAEP